MYTRFSNKLFNRLCQIEYSRLSNIFWLTIIIAGFIISNFLIMTYWSIVPDLLLLFLILIIASEKTDKNSVYLANLIKNRYYTAKYSRVKLETILGKPSNYFKFVYLNLRLFYLDNYINLLYWLVLLFKSVENNFDNLLDNVHHLYFDILSKNQIHELSSGRLSHEEKQIIYESIFSIHKVRQSNTAALSATTLFIIIIINIIVGLVISLILPALL